MQQALENASRPSQSKNKLLKKEYLCKECTSWFQKEVHIDHIEECGACGVLMISRIHRTINNEDVNGYQVPKPCHTIKSNETEINNP
jgi:hypothetical protein